MIPEESYFTTTGIRDMFWPRVFDLDFIAAHCRDKYGVTPRPEWMRISYGNAVDLARAGVSNIVFSNGGYDPWSSGGIKTSMSASLPAILIPTGAHHIDTFFSDPEDPAAVTDARRDEMAHIAAWRDAFYARAEL